MRCRVPRCGWGVGFVGFNEVSYFAKLEVPEGAGENAKGAGITGPLLANALSMWNYGESSLNLCCGRCLLVRGTGVSVTAVTSIFSGST